MKTPALLTVMFLLVASPSAAQHRVGLGSDTSTWFAWGGQLRLRGENWRGFGAGAPAGADHDDAFILSRALLRGEIQWRNRIGVLAEVKSSLAASRDLSGGRRPSDEDVLDLQQLFVEISLRPAGVATTVRGGRFELALGRERLVSPLDWTNTRRAFKGAVVRATRGRFDARLFVTRPIAVRRRQPNIADSTRWLYGAWLTRAFGGAAVDVYWLRNESRTAAFNGTGGSERRHTLGARVSRRPAAGAFDADVEAAWQSGTIGGFEIGAWMVAAQAGRTWRGARALRTYAGLDVASGDDTPGGNVGTFNQLFPLGHAFLGYADVHGRQNVVAVHAGFSAQPWRGWTAQFDVHDFSRASDDDGLYGVDGALVRGPGANLPMHLGTEIDVTVRRPFAGGRMLLQAGASRYWTGAFFEQSGPSRDITWCYVQATLTL